VKIFDFGLAHVPGTKDDCMPGTVHYMAPEQINGDPLDQRTDIYATGIMAYELMTGCKPFESENVTELLEAQKHQEISDPRLLVPGLPAEFYSILLRATQKDPNKRFKNIWELQRSFRQLAEKAKENSQSSVSLSGQMKGFMLFYPDDLRMAVEELVDDLDRRAAKIGVALRKMDLRET
jgi:serine/threonine protein kinase